MQGCRPDAHPGRLIIDRKCLSHGNSTDKSLILFRRPAGAQRFLSALQFRHACEDDVAGRCRHLWGVRQMRADNRLVYEGFKLPSTNPINQNERDWIDILRCIVGDADPPSRLPAVQALRRTLALA